LKIFKIIDEENALLVGVLMYFEKEKSFIIELPDYLDEWTAPLLFTSYVKRRIYTIPKDISLMWVKERIIPSGRQNISDILNKHHLQTYDEMKFLEISEGRCSQDSLYIEKINELPDFASKRRKQTIEECVLLENNRLLCFFADDTIRKIDLRCLKDVEDLDRVLSYENVFRTGVVGTGGYSVEFNASIEVPSWLLHETGELVPLTRGDFRAFISQNLLDTGESCDVLECSRQNVSYLVKQKSLTPVKENVRGNLYLKGDVVRNRW
jgi:hypothetical protein